MAQKKLISQSELELLQKHITEANKVQLQIGGVEAHKFELVKSLQKISLDLARVQKELEEKYGSVNIDLKTGEINPIEKAGAANKED